MDSQPKRLQATALFAGAVLAIAGVFAAAYFLYPLHREPRLSKRNYRLLAAIAGQVGKRIEGLTRAVQTAQDNSTSPCEERDTQTLKCVAPDELPAEVRMAAGSDHNASQVAAYVHDDDGTLMAYFMVPGAPAQSQQASGSTAQTIPATELGKFINEVVEPYGYFDSVLLASAQGNVLYQSDVPIVDGRALYHSSISTGRIGSIQDLIAGEQAQERKEGAQEDGDSAKHAGAPPHYVFSPAKVETVQYLGEEYLLFAQPLSAHVVVVGDKGAGSQQSASLVLFGLVSSRSFAAETRQIPWEWLGGLVFLLVLTFLSWPLLRLWRMGPGEPLRGADVRLISFVFMTGAMVITFFVLDLAFYASISARFDDLLEPLAREISERFQGEVADAAGQLDAVLNRCKDCRAVSCSVIGAQSGSDFADLILADSGGQPTCRWFARPDSKLEGWQLKRADKPPQMRLADRTYFRDARSRVLWSLPGPRHECAGGPCGVTAEVVNSRISGDDVLVIARPADESAPCGSPGAPCPQSAPPRQQHDPAVGLIATRMLPFAHPVLPMGFGFAIVNDQGDVQIHSVASRNKRENLFRECDDATGVRAAVGTRMPARLDVSYSGHDYRIFVMPLLDTPWSLVVFRDKQLLWAANSEIISSWAMLTLLYLAVWVAAAIVLQVCDSTYSAAWLWPCRYGGGTRSYLLVAAQTGLLAVIAYLGLQRVEALRSLGRFVPLLVHFAMVLIFPAVTVAAACLALADEAALGFWERRLSRALTIGGGIAAGACVALLVVIFLGPQAPFNYQVPAIALFASLLGAVALINMNRPKAVPHRRPAPLPIAGRQGETAFRFAFVTMLFSLVMALAVVPAVVFFQSASAMEVTNLSRMAQMRWIGSLAARAKRLRAETALKVSSPIFSSRFDDTRDIYPGSGFPGPITWQDRSGAYTGLSVPGEHAPLIAELLNGLGLPKFTPLMSFAAELRMMTSVSDPEGIGPYTWGDGGKGAEVMVVRDDSLHDLLGRTRVRDHLALADGGGTGRWSVFVRRGFPCFGTSQRWSIFGGMALGGLFAAFAVFAALWSIACKLFLLDADLNGDEAPAAPSAELNAEEKLALWHLVRLGFFNPGDGASARALFRRGVLCRNPAFHVREAEYRQIQQLDKSEMLKLESEAHPPVSPRLHHVLLPAIALAMTFLFLTQRELFNSAVALIATLAAALPTVLKFFSQLGGSPEKT